VFQRERVAQTVVMNDVWIGDGAIILHGVTIGTGAVIGGNSLVGNDIPPYAIVGGIPARIIRYRFPEVVIEMLLASEWWEAEPEYLRRSPAGNVLKFLQSHQAGQNRKHALFKTFALRTLPTPA
jgi:tetrahydrodipicolinate N-succinyltransferase